MNYVTYVLVCIILGFSITNALNTSRIEDKIDIELAKKDSIINVLNKDYMKAWKDIKHYKELAGVTP